jgi:hypothetical protein
MELGIGNLINQGTEIIQWEIALWVMGRRVMGQKVI